MLNRMTTEVNLRRRGSSLVEISCPLCELEEETVTHLFLMCSTEIGIEIYVTKG